MIIALIIITIIFWIRISIKPNSGNSSTKLQNFFGITPPIIKIPQNGPGITKPLNLEILKGHTGSYVEKITLFLHNN